MALSTKYTIEKQILKEDLKYEWEWLQWRGVGLNIVGTTMDLKIVIQNLIIYIK